MKQFKIQPLFSKYKQLKTINWRPVLTVVVLLALTPHPGPVHKEPALASSITIVQPLPVPAIAEAAPMPLEALPVAQPGTYSNDYAYGNCTSLAASMVPVPNSLGNANQWDDKASVVSTIPVVGMIAQTDAGWAGHVAVVVAVGDGTVTVKEMNYSGFNQIDTRVTPVTDWVYLYFNG